MEALERYSSGIVNEEELIKATKNEPGEKAIDPRKFVAYSEKQIKEPVFPLNLFSENNIYYWKDIEDFESGRTKYLPVECIYYPVDTELAPNRYTFGNSSGVASGLSFEAAARRGIYEAIERDAFMITWLNRITPPHFDLPSLPQKLRNRIEGINSQGYEVFLVDLTLDLAPVILAAAISHSQKSALMLGMSSDLNVEKAIHSALAEVERQLYWEQRSDTEVEYLESEKEIEGVFDHMAFYASPERLTHASFLWSGDEVSLTDKVGMIYNGGGELETLVSILKNESIDLLTVDMTCPALDDLGVKVVRAIPLGLVPISFGYGMEPLGMQRLEKVPNKLGLQVGSKHERPTTHPFA